MATASPPIRLLIVDDDEVLRQTLAKRFQRSGMEVLEACCGPEALGKIVDNRFDVALLDLHMPGMTGLELMNKLKEKYPETEILLLTGHASIESAIQAMKQGAYDYLPKPFNISELEIHIHKAYEKVKLARREQQWVDQLNYESSRYQLIGSSPAMQRIVQLIQKVAPADATVLIRGASGTGKEVVARALHSNSNRRKRPLVTINCAALQETLLESELFGHEKGSFTGAVHSKPGLVELAEGGTLFIDEIAEMAPGLQAKLLRVLENGTFRRVGGTEELRADVRVIAATNKDLEAEMKAHHFREDLFYRLNVVSVSLPPLNSRREDIPDLVRHFLKTRQLGPKPYQISPEALGFLCQYDWPGNVRELANVLERAQILAEDHLITPEDLPDSLVEKSHHIVSNGVNPDPFNLPHAIREVEQRLVMEVYRQEKGNKVHAAKRLGISRRALYRLLQKYGVQDE